jgi:hypothetical protein
VTYGENTGAIRDELAALLRHHRIQQRLGGEGTHTVPRSTTAVEREQLGRQIRRYRYSTLVWCRQALEAVGPKTDVHQATQLRLGPLDELRKRLDRSLSATEVDPPLLKLLGLDHEFDLLTRWQRIARAAALGEHDFAADVNMGWLTPEQGRTVAKDAADVIRGLVVLDRRYERIPGWKRILSATYLNHSAERVSRLLANMSGDLRVDSRGWRPVPAALIEPAMLGPAGAVQAQHNLLVDLAHFPHALKLRRLLHAQAQLSNEAARHAAACAPDLVERFLERQRVYHRLVSQTRNMGGVVGDGGHAVAEGQNAVHRLQRSSLGGPGEGATLHQLHRLFMHTDVRIACTIERGFEEKLYFVSVKVPRMTDQQINGVHQPRQRWMPVAPALDAELFPIIRNELRPKPIRPTETRGARANRQAYEAALTHRPALRGPPR